jgi:transcriptional/translational regulatory protein YebC/TACO1
LNNKLPTELATRVPSAALKAGLHSSSIDSLLSAVANGTSAALAAVPGISSSIESAVASAVTDSRVKAYSYIYYASIAVNGVGIIAAICLRDYDHLLNSHIPRQIYRDGQGAKGQDSNGQVIEKIDMEAHTSGENSVLGEKVRLQENELAVDMQRA